MGWLTELAKTGNSGIGEEECCDDEIAVQGDGWDSVWMGF